MFQIAKIYAFNAKQKVKKFITKENGDVNIVSIVVLIGIAVLLAVVFKDRIGELLRNLFDSIKTDNVMNDDIPTHS